MKNKIIAFFTSLFLLYIPLSAYAEDIVVDVDTAITITTEHFSYTSSSGKAFHNGFYLETELVDPDLMVVGMEYYGTAPEVQCYIVTPINGAGYGNGIGRIGANVIENQVDQQLSVGDLLKIDGEYVVTDVYPTTYAPREDCTVTLLGNSVDILGEEFERIVRLQLFIDQTAYLKALEQYEIYGFNWVTGDVNVDDTLSIVDCVMLNKSLMGDETLCDYAELAADFDKNGEVTHEDSLSILKRLVGLV